MTWYSRRAFGDVLDNGLALQHNRPVLRAVVGFERRVEKWSALDDGLKTLAVMASAGVIGCSWRLNFGWYQSHSKGLDTGKVEEVPRLYVVRNPDKLGGLQGERVVPRG